MATITGTTISSGYTLLTNPTTITNTATVGNTASYSVAVYGPAGTNWTLTNSGLVSETVNGGIGISLAQYGIITNASGGTITAAGSGIVLTGGGIVTNASGGLISGAYGAIYAGAAATVTNAGRIAVNQTGGGAIGVSLAAGGSVTNAAGGTISGYNGIEIEGAPGTVVNLGRIIADFNNYGNYGVYLQSGGTVINGTSGGTASAAYIHAYHNGVRFGPTGSGTLINYGTVYYGQSSPAVALTNGMVINGPDGDTGALIESSNGNAVQFYGGGTGTVVNYGTIKVKFANSGDYGVALIGGTISNLGTASLIVGTDGVYAGANATVINAGTISDDTSSGLSNDFAVKFGSGTNRLIVDPGAVFIGSVYAGSGGSSVLELASGSSTGTISGLGSNITNFGSLVFDTGADWKITGNDSANGLGSIDIGGFHSGDTIELTGFVAANRTFASNLLTLGDGAGHYQTLNIQGNFTTGNFQITGTGGNTDVTVDVPCYRRGTRILTDHGEVAVEDLQVGDLVQTVTSDTAEPIIWIGYRQVDCARHKAPDEVWPVRIAAGAFGTGMPHADLFLSPDHAVFVDGVLIPVRYLINGSTIAQVPVDHVSYYHIELATHEVILAQGLPAETYLDTGDRIKFGNNSGPVALLPDFSVRIWEASGCAPLIVTGAKLSSVRRAVNARAEAMDRQAAATLLVA